jgi:hypothetical protein
MLQIFCQEFYGSIQKHVTIFLGISNICLNKQVLEYIKLMTNCQHSQMYLRFQFATPVNINIGSVGYDPMHFRIRLPNFRSNILPEYQT